MYILFRFIAMIIGYAFGLIQSGYIIGKLYKIDIREHGSGSSGATNMTRTLGKLPGLITFVIDVFKPIAAYLVTSAIFSAVDDKEVYKIICLYACAATVIGHIYPFYLKFRGGKGVASFAGMAIIFSFGIPSCPESFPAAVVAISLFALIVAVSKYVSLGSICAVFTLWLMHVIFGQSGKLYFETGSIVLYEWYALLGVIVIIIIAKHSANIKRLIKGNENKLSFGSKK